MKVTWKTCFRVGLSIFVLYLCIYYWDTLSGALAVMLRAAAPFFIGLIIAYVLNILMCFYERHYFPKKAGVPAVEKSRRPVCLIFSLLTLLAIITLVIWLVLPELVSCVKFLLSEIPPAINRFLSSEFVSQNLSPEILSRLSSINWEEYAGKAINLLINGIGDTATIMFSAVSSIFSVIATAFISIIFAVYMLLGREKLSSQLHRLMKCYLPGRWINAIESRCQIFNQCFRGYIVGQCTEAVILGLLCGLGMLLLRFPYAGMIGTLVGFTALIPIVGAFIGAGVGAFMILTQSPIKALLFIIFIVVLQQLEGNLIYPKVVGKSIGLPAIWVLAAVTVGGGLLGIPGMLIGVPVSAALYRLLSDDIRRRESCAAGAETGNDTDENREKTEDPE